MTRSVRKAKEKKGKNGKKIKEATSASKSKNKASTKRSKFSAKNNDIVHLPQNPVFGSPTAYLYGKQAIDAKEVKKRKRQSKNSKKRNSNSNFVPRQSNKRGKRIFIAKFPVIGSKSKLAPWIKNKKMPPNAKANKENQQRKLLNGAFSIDESAMKLFNAELEEFAQYVKLTRTEIQAREYLIKEIQKSCKNLFGVEASQCQVFGSFAALPVCIFESDIDLAIWGVVEPDPSSDDDEVEEQQQSIAKRENNPSVNNINNSEECQIQKKKQERVLKWKALIDDATNLVQQKSEKPQGKTNEQPIEQPNEKSGGENETDDQPLFVLDRIGEASSSESDAKGSGSADDPISYDDGGKDDKQVQPNADPGDDEDEDGDDASDAESEDSHGDDADKLENFWSRKGAGPVSGNGATYRADKNDESSSDESVEEGEKLVEFNDVPRGRPRGMSLISLSSETTCSVEATMDDSGMEVSFVVDAKRTQTGRSKPVGPQGTTRTQVVKALHKLTRPLRPHSVTMHVRKHARVPIINMVTRFGFECDIALGGHNGTDTSSYATTQLSRFKSFSTLVVFLKVLLNQQGLDKPFTGGLGSYTLYVLVASHIEQHLELGGADDPAEVLFTFFFRYGSVKHSNNKIRPSCRTPLYQEMTIYTKDGGSADMKSCFQIENCVTIFESCWQMLRKRLKGNFDQKFSILQYMIDAEKLKQGRNQCKTTVENKLRQVLGGRILNRRNFPNSPPVSSIPGLPTREEKKDITGDQEARELIRGYGQSVQRFMPIIEEEEPAGAKKRKNPKKNNKKKRPKTSP